MCYVKTWMRVDREHCQCMKVPEREERRRQEKTLGKTDISIGL